MGDTNNLLGFDQVVALTQKTINAQLDFIWCKTFDGFVFCLTVDDENYVHATTGTPVINVNLSSDGVVDYSSVLLQFPITSGSAAGEVLGKPISAPNLTGYTFQVSVNIGAADPLADNSGLTVPSSVQDQLNGINPNIYSISSVILDLDSIKYTGSGCVVLDANGQEDTGLAFVLSSFIDSVKTTADGNPFLLVFNRKLLPTDSPSEGVAAFYPTSAQYRTEFVGNEITDNDQNSLNLLIMTKEETAPSVGTNQDYPENLGPYGLEADGMMHIAADQFNTDYIFNLVLKAISDSIQKQCIDVVRKVTNYTVALSYQDKNYFTAKSDGWKFNWFYKNGTQGDDTTYGASPVIGTDSDISDIHQVTEVYCDCVVETPKSSSDGISIEMSVSGHLKIYGNWYERVVPVWLHDGQVLIGKDFNTTITIQPAASDSGSPGTLLVTVADVTPEDGLVTNDDSKNDSLSSPHYWENAAGSVIDGIAGLFGGEQFSDVTNDFEDHANSAISKFFTDFASDATSALEPLSSNVIMPTGDAYEFTSAQLDDEGNPKFAFTVKSF